MTASSDRRPSRASRSIPVIGICAAHKSRENSGNAREKKKSTDRKNLEIYKQWCVWNVMKVDASSSKRGQPKKTSGTHRQLDLGDLCSIEMVGGLIHAEPTLFAWSRRAACGMATRGKIWMLSH